MADGALFRWREGGGWLILAGRRSEGSEVDTQAIQKVPAGDPVVYIWAASDADTADGHLAMLHELGGPTGYLVDVAGEDDATLRGEIAQAGLIILGDGLHIGALRGGLVGAASEGMVEAFERGASILAVGAGAAVLGQWYRNEQGEIKAGLSWLEKAVIVAANAVDPAVLGVPELLVQHPECFAVGISGASALVFGPGGEVETWGDRQIRITLGSAFIQGAT